MRHGIPWWEKFWSWLNMSANGEDVYWSDTTLEGWLRFKKKEFEKLLRDGKIVLPPKGR